jgi:hypothetical protein
VKRFWTDLRLALLAQARARFLLVYAWATLIAVAVLRFALPEGILTLVLPAFLFGEPGLLGVSMAAAYRYLEKTEGSSSALLVTPLRPVEHVLALSVATSLVGTTFGAAAFAAVLGPDTRTLALVPPLFLQGILSGLLGFGLSLRYEDFPRFILGAIPWLALYQIPLLFHLGAVPLAAVVWIPTLPSLLAYRDLMGAGVELSRLGAWCAILAALAAAGTLVVTRLFERGIRARAELA